MPILDRRFWGCFIWITCYLVLCLNELFDFNALILGLKGIVSKCPLWMILIMIFFMLCACCKCCSMSLSRITSREIVNSPQPMNGSIWLCSLISDWKSTKFPKLVLSLLTLRIILWIWLRNNLLSFWICTIQPKRSSPRLVFFQIYNLVPSEKC